MESEISIEVTTVLQLQLRVVMQALEETELVLAKKPGNSRAIKQKTRLLTERKKLNRELNGVRRSAIAGEPFHPFEVVNKLWGRPYVLKWLKPHPKIRRALEIAETPPFDRSEVDELNEALEVATTSGFFATLSMNVNAPSGPLLGLRQIHSPTNFLEADHQVIIVAPFQYDQNPLRPRTTTR